MDCFGTYIDSCADLITRSAHFAFLNFSCKLKADTQFLKAHDY